MVSLKNILQAASLCLSCTGWFYLVFPITEFGRGLRKILNFDFLRKPILCCWYVSVDKTVINT